MHWLVFRRSIGYRWFGFLSAGDGDGIRFTWLQIVQTWGWALEAHDRGPDTDGHRYGVTVGLLAVWFYFSFDLPLNRSLVYKSGFGDAWGFTWRFGKEWGNSIHYAWFDTGIIHMPWSWLWFRRSHLAADGVTWVHELRNTELPQMGTALRHHENGRAISDSFGTFRDIKVWQETYPYRYVLKSGAVQEGTAVVKVGEMEWRWRWLMGLAWPRMIIRSIDVTFSDEVGERAGSWKGGTIGCGYDLKVTESPRECFDRMMAERKFR